MAHSFEDLESLWRACWIAAPEGANTFLEQLTAQWSTFRNLNQAGSLSSISKNSASQAAAFGGSSTLTTVDLERCGLAALRLYEQIASLLSSADETVIYTEGLLQLSSPPTEAFSDISCLRDA